MWHTTCSVRYFTFLEEEKKTRKKHLSTDDVTNQGRYLLNNFIHERMVRDGIINTPGVDELQEPGTPCGKVYAKYAKS